MALFIAYRQIFVNLLNREHGAALAWKHQWCRTIETLENAERQKSTNGTSEFTVEYWDTGNQLYLFYDTQGVYKTPVY